MISHILLIDDDEDEHLFFHWTLEKINPVACLVDAFTVSQATALLKQIVPDVIFLDINIPPTDGFDCLEQIKKSDIGYLVPVYMHSTELNQRTIEKAMSLGAAGCIKKSRNQDGLIRQIMSIMTSSQVATG
jgi:DNA-binding NarL/FixJ family response regulator